MLMVTWTFMVFFAGSVILGVLSDLLIAVFLGLGAERQLLCFFILDTFFLVLNALLLRVVLFCCHVTVADKSGFVL